MSARWTPAVGEIVYEPGCDEPMRVMKEPAPPPGMVMVADFHGGAAVAAWPQVLRPWPVRDEPGGVL